MKMLGVAFGAAFVIAGAAFAQSLAGLQIGQPVDVLAGAIWADRNNDGYVDGYVYSGQYYPGAPAGYQHPSPTQAQVAGPSAAGEIRPPESVIALRDGHLSVVGDENRYGFTQLVPYQSYTVVLLTCSPSVDFAMSTARPISMNQPRSGYYLSTLSLQIPKNEVWYRLRPLSKQDVGEPFTLAVLKAAAASDADLDALRPICAAPAVTPDEVKRRFGQLADMGHKSLVSTNGQDVFDFDWIVPGRSMILYTRSYGEKYTNSASLLLSWDERRQKIHSQYISAGAIKDDYFTPVVKTAHIIPYEDDRRRASIARANSGGGGGGLGGFLKGALAGAAGMAMGASPETAAESMIAGAVAGGVLGANGEDPGMIGAAAAEGSALGTAQVEASNAELRRISEQGIRNASGGSASREDSGSADESQSGTGEAAAPESSRSTTTKSARAHYSLSLRLTDQSTRNPICYSREFTLQFPSTGDRSEDYRTIDALMEAKAGRFQELCTRTRQAALDPPSWQVEGYTSYGVPTPHLEPGNDILVDAPQ